MPSRIEEYALVGDCESAALVSRDGSIDWLCLPRFDSGACFAALLGEKENGRWLIAPSIEVKSISRRYREGTLILETDYETASGAVRIIDFMPLRNERPDLVRIVEGRRGQVPMHMEMFIRFDYGWVVPWVRRTEDGIQATAGPDTLYLRTAVELRGEDLHTISDFTVSEGERIHFELVWAPTHAPEPSKRNPEDLLRDTEVFWREWSYNCLYQGEWKEAVDRSLITLKALTYAPTGGILAAATTSLPERIGGERNWDYRHCWLRDATFTLYALTIGGYTDEAGAWREWLVNAVAGSPSKMQIMYGLAGERRLTELELKWLPGYERSSPVRIGNAAFSQHQLDVYGEVMDALYLARRMGLVPSENAWRVQRALMDFLETDWNKPDEGIWEIRGPRRQFTHSKVMAWVAVDRAVKSVELFGLDGPVDDWKRLRKKIHEEICEKGFDPQLNSFVQFYGSRETDASLLMIPIVGFLPASDPRMRGTVEYIQKRLMQDGFVQRYLTDPEIDGLPPGEGAFLICTFWLADNLALQGQYKKAREIFERLLDLRNDVGLLSEQYDPAARRLLGNFPQAFSHVGLINTARNLDREGGPARDRQDNKYREVP
ncbi:MAG TPA: glycoside hydrolase family 15 protein [Blastocatellia bacterium]|nr:glycoside hydrolase family 15 protein [Blastocatellia bacterium]